jgi:hypothetical protein
VNRDDYDRFEADLYGSDDLAEGCYEDDGDWPRSEATAASGGAQ